MQQAGEATPLVGNGNGTSNGGRSRLREGISKLEGSSLRRTKTILQGARERLRGGETEIETSLDKVVKELQESEEKGSRFFWVALFFIGNHILGGVITLHFLEGWNFYDCAYFCIVTTTTVGYGDITPQSKLSKLFVIYYVIVSIALISTMLAYLVGIVIDQQEEVLLSAVIREREEERQEHVDGEVRVNMSDPYSATQRIERATQRMGKSDWYDLIIAVISLFVVLLLGFLVFFIMEDLSFVDALYATVISATTVGFGDYQPTKNSTKILMTIWLCFSTIGVGKVIADFTDASVRAKQRDVSRRLLTAQVDIRALKLFDTDNDGHVDKAEFLTQMLVASGKVEQEEIDTIMLRFDELDRGSTGVISVSDVQRSMSQRYP